MKIKKGMISKRIVLVLLLVVLIQTGCSSKSCEVCGKAGTVSYYNVDDAKDVRYYCDRDDHACDVCRLKNPGFPGEVIKFKEQADGRIVYLCGGCSYEEWYRIVNSVSGGIVG